MTSKIDDLAPLLGGPAFDYETYYKGVEQAKLLLRQAVETLWLKQCKAEPYYARIKPVARALFYEEYPHGDPDLLVHAGREPFRVGKGWEFPFYSEIVPAWVLYINRASELLAVVEKAITP